MRTLLIGVALLASSVAANAKDLEYEGTWVTTNRKLDGTMTCVVTELGGDRWRGQFSGVYAGRPFAYTVEFSGPPEGLRGRAVIDGADYEWKGEIGREFKGTFTGNRYLGNFTLRKKDK